MHQHGDRRLRTPDASGDLQEGLGRKSARRQTDPVSQGVSELSYDVEFSVDEKSLELDVPGAQPLARIRFTGKPDRHEQAASNVALGTG
jgi:hypothetical protein